MNMNRESNRVEYKRELMYYLYYCKIDTIFFGGQKNSQGGQKTFILSGQKNNPSRGESGGQKTQVQGGQKNSVLDLSNDNRQKLLQLIKQEPMISRKKLSDELQINESAIQKHLDYLKNEKIIIRKGGAKGGYWHLLKKDLYA